MMSMIEELLKRLRDWNRESARDYERSQFIELRIRIPYTPGNEAALRGLTVGGVCTSLTVAFPVALERVEVRCTQNPNWRR